MGMHQHQERIAIAVQTDGNDVLIMAAGRALMPQFAPTAAPEYCLAQFQGLGQSLAIHISQGQHLACARVLDDSGNERGFTEINILYPGDVEGSGLEIEAGKR